MDLAEVEELPGWGQENNTQRPRYDEAVARTTGDLDDDGLWGRCSRSCVSRHDQGRKHEEPRRAGLSY